MTYIHFINDRVAYGIGIYVARQIQSLSPNFGRIVIRIVEFFQQSFEIGISDLMLDDPHDRSSLSAPYRSRKELLSVRDIARPPLYSRPSILLGRMKFFRTYLENPFRASSPCVRTAFPTPGEYLQGKPASTNQSPFAGNPRAAVSSCFKNASPYRSTTPRPRHRCFPR